MGIKADFEEAERIIAGLRPVDRVKLCRICDEIQAAETDLLKQAEHNMDRCIAACQGLCCRNIQLEAIIGVWDLVYILTVAEAYRDRMAACLEKEMPVLCRRLHLSRKRGGALFASRPRPGRKSV